MKNTIALCFVFAFFTDVKSMNFDNQYNSWECLEGIDDMVSQSQEGFNRALVGMDTINDQLCRIGGVLGVPAAYDSDSYDALEAQVLGLLNENIDESMSESETQDTDQLTESTSSDPFEEPRLQSPNQPIPELQETLPQTLQPVREQGFGSKLTGFFRSIGIRISGFFDRIASFFGLSKNR
jgi:hypothetical protein